MHDHLEVQLETLHLCPRLVCQTLPAAFQSLRLLLTSEAQ